MKFLKVILVVALLGVLAAGMLLGQEELPPPTEPVLLLPTFGEAPNLSLTGFEDYSARFANVAELGVAAGATEAQKLEAAYAIYRMGCYTYYTAPYRAERTYGGGYGGVPDDTIGGYMDVYSRSFKVHSKDASEPYAYYGYYEFYSQLSEVKGPDFIVRLKQLVASALTNTEREADAPEGRTHWQGIKGSAVLDHEGGTGTFLEKGITFTDRATIKSDGEEEIANGNRRGYDEDWYDQYGHSAPEKTQHTINKNTIEADSIQITKDTDKNNDEYYNVKFNVICNEESTGFEAQSIQRTSPMIQFLSFDYLIVELEVYTNGYMRRWSCSESWIGGLKVSVFNIDGKTASGSNTYISYDKDVVTQGLADLWFGDYDYLSI